MIKIFFFLFIPFMLFGSQKISIQLNWEAQFEFAGFYVAKELGFYKKEGLDVTIQPLDLRYPIDIEKAVLSNEIDIGVHYASIIPKAIDHDGIMILSYLFQTSPLVGLSKKPFEKLSKKDCFYLSKNESQSSLDILLQKVGIVCRKKRDKKAFLADKNGILSAFISNESYEYNNTYLIEPRKYGYDFYDDIIFTSKKFYKKHKKEVRRFIIATIKGWRYALKHIDEAVTIMTKYAPQKTKQQLIKEAKGFLAYSIFSVDTVGVFNHIKLNNMVLLYRESNICKKTKELYEFVDPLFLDYIDMDLSERKIIADTKIHYSETNWPPFCIIKNKKPSGIIEDYIEKIAQKTGLNFVFEYRHSWSKVLEDIKSKKLDMAMATGETPERKKWAVFSLPYGVYSFAIATRRDHIITDISELKSKVIAVGKSYTALEVLKKYDGILLKEVKNTKEALALLHKGEVDGVADILPTLAYFIAMGNYKDIVIAQTLQEKFVLKGMFQKDLSHIVSIYNKALATLSNEEKRLISKKYSSEIVYAVNQKKEEFFFISILVLIVLVVLFASIAYRLKKELQKRLVVEQQLQELTHHDPLTGLYNRRFFHHVALIELKNLKRVGGKVMFAIYDIDNFKLYNDYYGHLEGDSVLMQVSNKIQEICKRENDYLFRLGGEEFGIFTRVDDPTKAVYFIKNIVKEVEKLQIEHRYNKPYGIVTISLGAIVIEVPRGHELSIEELYAQADELMYKAKRQGKNNAIVEIVINGSE